MLKIILVDDHKMFRESLKKLMVVEQIADVIAEASNGLELIDHLKTLKPDIVLLDIAMPKMDGIEAAKEALKIQPNLKILTLSSFDDHKYYFSMLEAGVKGFVLKNAGIDELRSAITEVANDGNWFSSNLLQNVISSMNSKPSKDQKSELNDRELEILRFICDSLTNEQIAEKINLSKDTVKWHRANILSKTGCTNTAGLVIYAIRNKIIEI